MNNEFLNKWKRKFFIFTTMILAYTIWISYIIYEGRENEYSFILLILYTPLIYLATKFFTTLNKLRKEDIHGWIAIWAAIKTAVNELSYGVRRIITLFILFAIPAVLPQLIEIIRTSIEWHVSVTDLLIATLTMVLACIEWSRWKRENLTPLMYLQVLEIKPIKGIEIFRAEAELTIVNNSTWAFSGICIISLPYNQEIDGIFNNNTQFFVNPTNANSYRVSFDIENLQVLLKENKKIPAVVIVQLDKSENETIEKRWLICIDQQLQAKILADSRPI